ncbi:hypothetical protein KKC74_15040 [bacterium]|nr:hypothetical protein [bacterium]
MGEKIFNVGEALPQVIFCSSLIHRYITIVNIHPVETGCYLKLTGYSIGATPDLNRVLRTTYQSIKPIHRFNYTNILPIANIVNR